MSSGLDVVITGRGLITPLGFGLLENLKALIEGKSGISYIQQWHDLGLESQIAGKVNTDFECHACDRKQLRFMPDSAKMAVEATFEAITEAGYTKETLPGDSMAVIVGCAGSGYNDFYKAYTSFEKYRTARRVSPFTIPKIMPSSAVSNLSLIYKIKGESYDVSCACASGAAAIVQAVRLIQSGAYDIVLAGGAEEISWQNCLGFTAMHALSHSFNDTPEKSSRPFDVNRDGFVLAEASGMLVLESRNHAESRGAKIISTISGYAMNSNATDMVAPDADSISNVIQKALDNAKLHPSDIAYINAHATSTEIGDLLEMKGCRKIFGTKSCSPMINSTKSQTGHAIGAAGAIELIFTTQMMEHSFVSGTINLDRPDESMMWADLVRETRLNIPIRHAMSNSFAFGGTNVSLVLSSNS